nr:sulfatase-like hydrolase/transferase [Oscillospiraceae bacterium]
MKKSKILGTVPIPGWLYAIALVLYCETILHLWILEEFSAVRFAAVLAFALGFGGILAQIVSFIGHKHWGKWVTVAITGIVAAFYIVEYFVSDAYMVFMPMGTLLGGAKGVATDFGDVVIQLVVRDFWRILVVVLPVILYALFAVPVKTSWRTRWFGLVIALAAYLLGFQVVSSAGTDAARLSDAYNFDSAIRVFGLNMGMTLDAVHSGSGEEEQGDFVVVENPAPAVPATPEETTPQETEAVAYADNVMDFDFAAMAEAETNSRIANIHKYVNTVAPTKQNEFTGLFKGKNLILITAEAFAKEVIDPELTPTLYRLANEGIRFEDYYQPMWGGSTSSGEFSILTGLVSASGTNSIKESQQQDLFLSIGKQLQKEGYHSVAYHNHLYTFYDRHKTHTLYGYDEFIGMKNGMEAGVKDQWPESDLEMMEFTVQQYIDKQPFSVYYMTVSGHCRYNTMGNKMSKKHYDVVKDLDCSETLKAYYACQMELEYALESLVRQLEEAGIADDTVIVLSTDHYPYGLENSATWGNKKDYIAEMYGYDPKDNIERDHSALIIWSGCLEDMDLVVEEPVYSLDILPTISNLFGVEYDSRLIVGRDVFSDAEPIVLWYDYTWKTDKGRYDSSSRKFTPVAGVEVDEAYVERISNIVYNKIYYSREAQNTDYFDYLAEEMEKWQ